MPGTLAIVACANHESREAIGVCVRCRRRVCSECTTKLDGINHCVSCFAELAAEHAGPASSSGPRSEWASALSFVVALGLAASLGWAALELLLPGGG